MSPTLTFAGGSTTNMDSEIVQVRVADDDIYDRSEQVTVSIASVRPASVALIGEHHVHTFTLLDNNGITKYSSTLYIGMDEVFAHYACTFENSDLHSLSVIIHF